MPISEPTTLATDYALAGLSGFLAWRMFETSGRVRTRRYWAFALAATAVASFAGGTYHGFGPVLPPHAAAALWKLTTLSMGVASFFLTASAAYAAFGGSGRAALLALATIKLLIYSWWMSTHDAFVYVICDYGSTLLFILVLVAANRLHGETGQRTSIAGGIVVSVVAALLQQSGLRLHAHFNHNDLMHVVQMLAVWLLYRGGSGLYDASGRG